MDMQKIVTLDGFGVRADPRDHFGKNATLNKSQVLFRIAQKILADLIVWVPQPFEVVRGPCEPRISILGLK